MSKTKEHTQIESLYSPADAAPDYESIKYFWVAYHNNAIIDGRDGPAKYADERVFRMWPRLRWFVRNAREGDSHPEVRSGEPLTIWREGTGERDQRAN